MGKLGKITGMMVSPKKAQEKMKKYNYKVGKKLLIKGLPLCIKENCNELKKQGIKPTVDNVIGTIFNEDNQSNLDFYHKMDINDDYIKGVINKVIEESKNEK